MQKMNINDFGFYYPTAIEDEIQYWREKTNNPRQNAKEEELDPGVILNCLNNITGGSARPFDYQYLMTYARHQFVILLRDVEVPTNSIRP